MPKFNFQARKKLAVGKGDDWNRACKAVLLAIKQVERKEIKARTAMEQLLSEHPVLRRDTRVGAHPLSALIPAYTAEILGDRQS